jgi:predicted NUDIX family NTP pyrophosphohydrolase
MKRSAGILAYRTNNQLLQVFLVHPGGPYFTNKDAGFWTIPKGEFDDDEEPLAAAQREFLEETGVALTGNFMELEPIIQKSGKKVYAWAIDFDIDETKTSSNTFEIEWPPRSGLKKMFPEIDKAQWFTANEAKQKINAAQVRLIDELMSKTSKGFQ